MCGGLSWAAQDKQIVSHTHPPARTLRVYAENLMRLSHIYHPESLNHTLLSQSRDLEEAPSAVDRMHSPRMGVRSPSLVQAHLPIQLMTFTHNQQEWCQR